MNRRNFTSTVQVNIPEFQFSTFSMNWEILRATFKNPSFQSHSELEKTWNYRLSPKFKGPNVKSVAELKKVMS